MKRILSLLGLITAAILTAAPLAADCGATHASKSADIVDTAVGAGSFTTLVAAVQAAGLVDTLRSDGPFTVFAPTDEAFAKLPAGTVDSLLANPDQLRQILLYHVVPGSVSASQVVELNSATTAQGSDVQIRTVDGKVMIDNASVLTTDIATSNGIIHVIDTVILPKS